MAAGAPPAEIAAKLLKEVEFAEYMARSNDAYENTPPDLCRHCGERKPLKDRPCWSCGRSSRPPRQEPARTEQLSEAELRVYAETRLHAIDDTSIVAIGAQRRQMWKSMGADLGATHLGDLDGYLVYESYRWRKRAELLREELGERFFTDRKHREAKVRKLIYRWREQGKLPPEAKFRGATATRP